MVETDFWVGYTFSLGELAALNIGNNYYTFKDYDATSNSLPYSALAYF